MADVRNVLQRCDPAMLDTCGDPEEVDCAEAAMRVLYLTDSRGVQKVLQRQLFVLYSMMPWLDGLESARQLMTQPTPPQPEGGARRRWRALKAGASTALEEKETVLRSLQEKIQHILDKRHTLTERFQCLRRKQQQSKEQAEYLQKAQNTLQSCDHQLSRLRAESEMVRSQLVSWQQLRDKLQEHDSAVQDVGQNMLSFSESELSVKLRSRLSSNMSSNELELLRLSVTWSEDDLFRLQVNEGIASLEEDCMSGRRYELRAALLDVMQCYAGQYELLAEIQGLRSSFAIDWRPSQRLLIYLKTAVLVCHLKVEDGYPSSGKAPSTVCMERQSTCGRIWTKAS